MLWLFQNEPGVFLLFRRGAARYLYRLSNRNEIHFYFYEFLKWVFENLCRRLRISTRDFSSVVDAYLYSHMISNKILRFRDLFLLPKHRMVSYTIRKFFRLFSSLAPTRVRKGRGRSPG